MSKKDKKEKKKEKKEKKQKKQDILNEIQAQQLPQQPQKWEKKYDETHYKEKNGYKVIYYCMGYYNGYSIVCNGIRGL